MGTMPSREQERPSRSRRWARLVPAVAAATVLATLGTPYAPKALASSVAGPVAYVVESGSKQLLPVDLATGSGGQPIGLTGASAPTQVAIVPDGSEALVTDSSGNQVIPVNLVTGVSETPIPVGQDPVAVAVAPDGRTAYVVDHGSSSVTPIDLVNGTAGSAIPVGLQPQGIAITPNGATAYVTDSVSDTVTPISLASGLPGMPIPVGQGPGPIVVSPDGGTVLVADTSSNSITPISTYTNATSSALVLPGSPVALAISVDPQGQATAWAAASGVNELVPIDMANGQLGAPISIGAAPTDLFASPDGATLAVTSASAGDVFTVSTSAAPASALQTTSGGLSAPAGVSVVPHQGPTAVLTVTPSCSGATTSTAAACVPAGQAVTLDASGSTASGATIASYTWYFGDGTPNVVTTSAQETHTYAHPGTYTADVVVTDSLGTSYSSVFTGQTISRNGSSTSYAAAAVIVSGSSLPVHTPIMLVANQLDDTVTPVGISAAGSTSVGSPVSLDPAASGGPSGPVMMAMTPDGSAAVVSEASADAVALLTICPDQYGAEHVTLAGSVSTGANSVPTGVAISQAPVSAASGSDTWLVLVADQGTNAVSALALTTDPATCSATLQPATSYASGVIPLGAKPVDIAIAPNGVTAYVTDSGQASVTPIDLSNGQVGAPIPVGMDPTGIAVNPSGSTVYVVDSGSNSVTPVSTSSNLPQASIQVGANPLGIAITPDGTQAFVTDQGSETVTPIDLASAQAGAAIPVGSSPTDVFVTPDGSTAYVSSYTSGTVTPLNTKTDSVGAPISGFSGPIGVSVTPDQAPVAALTTDTPAPTAGTAVTFDASASTVEFGSIVRYTWYFGDGSSPVTTSTPTVSHTFSVGGTFTVYVLESDSAGTSYQQVYTGQTSSLHGSSSSYTSLVVTVSGTPIPAGTPVLYVAESSGGQVSTIGIPPGGAPFVSGSFPAGSGPQFMAVTPDGTAGVVADAAGGTLTPFAACGSSGSLQFSAGSPQPAGASPNSVAIDPKPLSQNSNQTQWAVYSTDESGNDVYRFVLTVQTSGGCAVSALLSAPTPASVIPVGTEPAGIAITPDGSTAYVADYGQNQVTPINLSTDQPGVPIPVGSEPYRLAVTPDGKTVLVTDLGSNAVTAISTATGSPAALISVGSTPIDIALADGPGGSPTAYVTDAGSDTVTPIDVAADSAGNAIHLPFSPTGIAASPDGSTVYVTGYSAGEVVPIDTSTGVVGTPIAGFSGPIGAVAGVSP